MKTFFMILGGAVLVAVLGIGGCATFGFFALKGLLPEVPDYVTKSALLEDFGEDIKAVKSRLENGESIAYSSGEFFLDDDVLEILEFDSDSDFSHAKPKHVYLKHSVSKRSSFVFNGVGTASASVNGEDCRCMIYEFNSGKYKYWVLLKDHKYEDYMAQKSMS